MTKKKLLAKVNAMAKAGKKEVDDPKHCRNCPKFTEIQMNNFKLRNFIMVEKKMTNYKFKSIVRGVRFKKSTYNRLKHQALKDDRSINELVERYCEKGLPKENGHV
jgi:hypothetical protein